MFTAIVADDHHFVRRGLVDILAGLGHVEIVAEADNGIAAIALVRQHRPDLLLLDAAMPLARGIEVFAEVRRWSPATRVVVVTGFTGAALLADWMAAGVDGLLLKSCSAEELRAGFETVLAGGNYVAAEVADRIAKDSERAALTPREREVLALIATGHMNVAIAERLSISVKTVEKHRASLMAKLGVNSVSGLLVYALQEGLLDEHRQL